jgi:hypothetical protein
MSAYPFATGQTAVFELPRQTRPWPRTRRIAGGYAAALAAVLFVGSSGVAVLAQAEETHGERIPIETIRFEPGASATVVSGAVIRGESALYALDARSGQRLTLSISSEEDNAAFQVYRPGARADRRDYGVQVLGDALPGAAEGEDARTWSGVLPVPGTYLVAVVPTRGNATYKLSVTIR